MTNNSIKHRSFVYSQLDVKQFYFKQFNLAWVICLNTIQILNSSIWLIDRTLSGVTTPSQCGPGSDGNEEVLHISQSFSITEALASDCLMSYPWHSLKGSYVTAEMQLVYSTAPVNRAGSECNIYLPNPFATDGMQHKVKF